jgi:hypothetical protein
VTVGGTNVPIDAGARESAPLQDFFAPAQFFVMSDDESIAAPSFDTMDAGLMIGVDDFAFSDADMIGVVLTYETILVDTQLPPPPRPPGRRRGDYSLKDLRLFEQARFGAAARSAVQRTGPEKFRNRARTPEVALGKPGYVIASTEDLSPQAAPGIEAGKRLNFIDAQQALRKLNQQDPVAAKKRQVVPAYEAVN